MILAKTVNCSPSGWATKLDNALWAYHIAYKASFGMSPYQIVFGKAFHLLIELEHQALWALKKLNFNIDEALEARVTQLHLLNEFKLKAYKSSTLYKKKMKNGTI